MKKHRSTISFREKKGLGATSESTWVPFSSNITNSTTSSKDVTAAWIAFCAIRPTADDYPNLKDPRHTFPQCLAETKEDSLDQVVDHLRITCRIVK